jgi:hypothetical protein
MWMCGVAVLRRKRNGNSESKTRAKWRVCILT